MMSAEDPRTGPQLPVNNEDCEQNSGLLTEPQLYQKGREKDEKPAEYKIVLENLRRSIIIDKCNCYSSLI